MQCPSPLFDCSTEDALLQAGKFRAGIENGGSPLSEAQHGDDSLASSGPASGVQ